MIVGESKRGLARAHAPSAPIQGGDATLEPCRVGAPQMPASTIGPKIAPLSPTNTNRLVAALSGPHLQVQATGKAVSMLDACVH